MTLRRAVLLVIAVGGLIAVVRSLQRRETVVVVEDTGPGASPTAGVPADVAHATSMPA
jgi:hypothetical protein